MKALMTRRSFGFVLAPGLLLAQGTPADDKIYDDVRRRLALDAEVKGAGIDVTVSVGRVTLKGRVPTEKAKSKATVLCKKVKGVVSVENQLRLLGVD